MLEYHWVHTCYHQMIHYYVCCFEYSLVLTYINSKLHTDKYFCIKAYSIITFNSFKRYTANFSFQFSAMSMVIHMHLKWSHSSVWHSTSILDAFLVVVLFRRFEKNTVSSILTPMWGTQPKQRYRGSMHTSISLWLNITHYNIEK